MGFGLTNATKAVILGVVSSALNLLIVFGFELSGDQVSGINAFVDSILILWIALTFKDSPKRIEE